MQSPIESPIEFSLDPNSTSLHDLRRRIVSDTVSIMVADNDRLFVEGIAALVDQWEEFSLVAKAYSADEARRYARDLDPKVVLLGARIGGESSAQIIEDILSSCPETGILVLASSGEASEVLDALRAGAMGYCVRDEASADRLRGLVWGVACGEVILSGSLLTGLQKALADRSEKADDGATSAALETLTKRELDVLALITDGKSNLEIGEELYLSEPTVKKTVNRIMEKLQARNRVQVAVYAARHMK